MRKQGGTGTRCGGGRAAVRPCGAALRRWCGGAAVRWRRRCGGAACHCAPTVDRSCGLRGEEAHAAAWLQSGPGSERKHMWRRIYAAVAPPAADCSALASEDDGASFVRPAQRPLRSPPGTASCLTMAAAASALFWTYLQSAPS